MARRGGWCRLEAAQHPCSSAVTTRKTPTGARQRFRCCPCGTLSSSRTWSSRSSSVASARSPPCMRRWPEEQRRERQGAHLSRRAEEGENQRARGGRRLPLRNGGPCHPAHSLARRHGEGAGGGMKRRATIKRFARLHRRSSLVEVDEVDEVWPALGRARGADAQRPLGLRVLTSSSTSEFRPEMLMQRGRRIDDPAPAGGHHRRAACRLKLNDRQALLEMDDAAKRLERSTS